MNSGTVFSAALLLTLAACHATHDVDPRGPYPDARTGNVVPTVSENGSLTVATSRIRVDQEGRLFDLPNNLSVAGSHAVSSGYTVFDREGRPVLDVANHSPLVVTDENPTPVDLPPGRYLVRLDQPLRGVRAFWVTIESRRHTIVDPARLDENEEPQVR